LETLSRLLNRGGAADALTGVRQFLNAETKNQNRTMKINSNFKRLSALILVGSIAVATDA